MADAGSADECTFSATVNYQGVLRWADASVVGSGGVCAMLDVSVCYCHGAEVVGRWRQRIGGWYQFWNQTGYGLDVKHKNQKSTLETAKVRIRKETTRLLPEVQQEIEKNKEKHQRGKRKSTVEKEESMKKAKEERRKSALKED
jgi:hypothetical protein